MDIKLILISILVAGALLAILSFIFGLGGNGDKENGLARFVKWLNERFRLLDWLSNRNRFTPGDSKTHWMPYPEGHAWRVPLLTAAVLVFLFYGPTLELFHRGTVAFLATTLLIAALVLISIQVRREWLQPWLNWVLPGATAAVLFLSVTVLKEREPGIYLHVLLPFTGVLLLLLLVAWGVMLAPPFGLFRRYEKDLKPYLKPLEVRHEEATLIDWKRAWRSLLLAPFFKPLEILLWPSLCILVIADRNIMAIAALGTGVLIWAVYAAAEIHEGLDHLLGLLRRTFFLGGQLVVSIAAIALAFCRLVDFHYVTTLIEASPHRTNWTLLFYILAAYVFFWFFEYWINRLLGEHLLKAIRKSAANTQQIVSRSRAWIPYEYLDRGQPQKGVLQLHGGSRFALLPNLNAEKALKTYGRMDLLNAIIVAAGKPKTLAMKHRIRFYFICLYLLLAAILTFAGWHFYSLPQSAELTVNRVAEESGGFNLQESLFAGQAPEQALLLAASGGGTRAALYTQSLLEGLKNLNALDKVVLVSGVSGGSAALGYFAGHRQQLLGANPEAWKDFRRVVTRPFIQDVLEGISEWRMVAGTQAGQPPVRQGLRMGQLLAESFERNLLATKNCEAFPSTLGAAQEVGVILNTTLAGTFERSSCQDQESALNGPAMPLAILEKHCDQGQTSLGRGGRLILTNLDETQGFPPGRQIAEKDEYRLPEAPNEYLHYALVKDPGTCLATAAALSANFPPVFPNAAVDVGQEDRFWVTDGGAMDNRGIISLLYVLKDAIRQEHNEYDTAEVGSRQRPVIHVVVAEASAVDLGYSQDRGIGAKFGAPEQLASHLMVDLFKDIETLYASMGGSLKIHYLSMPLVLRSNGGLGTHWMFPANVTLRPPYGSEGGEEISLEGDTVKQIVTDLHRTQAGSLEGAEEHLGRVWDWICSDSYANHQRVWEELVNTLRPGGQDLQLCPSPQ